MSKPRITKPVSGDLANLSKTVVELFSDWNTERTDLDSGVLNRPRKKGNYMIASDVEDFPFRPNPFMGSVVAYDRTGCRLSILLSLGSPKRVVIEIYSEERRFVKRILDMQVEKGLTEITRVAAGLDKEAFVVILNCDDGIKSFHVGRS